MRGFGESVVESQLCPLVENTLGDPLSTISYSSQSAERGKLQLMRPRGSRIASRPDQSTKNSHKCLATMTDQIQLSRSLIHIILPEEINWHV